MARIAWEGSGAGTMPSVRANKTAASNAERCFTAVASMIPLLNIMCVFVLARFASGKPMSQWPAKFQSIGVRVSPTPRRTPVATPCSPSNS